MTRLTDDIQVVHGARPREGDAVEGISPYRLPFLCAIHCLAVDVEVSIRRLATVRAVVAKARDHPSPHPP